MAADTGVALSDNAATPASALAKSAVGDFDAAIADLDRLLSGPEAEALAHSETRLVRTLTAKA